MMDEIEKFLRQAAARRGGGQQPPPQPEIEFVEPEYVEPQPVDPRSVQGNQGRQIQSQVASRQIQTSNFDQRAAQRGTRERQADDMMEAHLHEKFDHEISDLSGESSRVASAYQDKGATPYTEDQDATPYVDDEAANQFARNLVRMFSSPASIQQAILMNEILQRPEHRW